MDNQGRHQLLLAMMALRSIGLGLNEIVLSLELLHQEGLSIGLDALVAETGLPRSTVASILLRWSKIGLVDHRRGQGYRLRNQSRRMVEAIFNEVEEISIGNRSYFSQEVLEQSVQRFRKAHRAYFPEIASALQRR